MSAAAISIAGLLYIITWHLPTRHHRLAKILLWTAGLLITGALYHD